MALKFITISEQFINLMAEKLKRVNEEKSVLENFLS